MSSGTMQQDSARASCRGAIPDLLGSLRMADAERARLGLLAREIAFNQIDELLTVVHVKLLVQVIHMLCSWYRW